PAAGGPAQPGPGTFQLRIRHDCLARRGPAAVDERGPRDAGDPERRAGVDDAAGAGDARLDRRLLEPAERVPLVGAASARCAGQTLRPTGAYQPQGPDGTSEPEASARVLSRPSLTAPARSESATPLWLGLRTKPRRRPEVSPSAEETCGRARWHGRETVPQPGA